MNLDSFPREPFLFGPSPVHPLDRLSGHLGGARLWAKRDDCKGAAPDRHRRLGQAQQDSRAGRANRAADRRADRVGHERRDDKIVLDDRYHAGTYGIPDETLKVMRTAARLEGMITDPGYEGKSMAGMIDLVSRGEINKSSNVLYAHLGGQPALSAHAGLFR